MEPNFEAVLFFPSSKLFACIISSNSTAICITRPARLCLTIDAVPPVFNTLVSSRITCFLSSIYSKTLWQIIISNDESSNCASAETSPIICLYWKSVHALFSISLESSTATTSLFSAKWLAVIPWPLPKSSIFLPFISPSCFHTMTLNIFSQSVNSESKRIFFSFTNSGLFIWVYHFRSSFTTKI